MGRLSDSYDKQGLHLTGPTDWNIEADNGKIVNDLCKEAWARVEEEEQVQKRTEVNEEQDQQQQILSIIS